MERLLSPDIGLSIWTILTFLILVAILGKVAWKPLIKSLEEREEGIRREREAAERARNEAETIKCDLKRDLDQIEARAQEVMGRAVKEGLVAKEEMHKSAQKESRELLERARRQLEEEKERLSRELRGEVAGLSVMAAEKLLKESVSPGVQKRVLGEFLRDLGKDSKTK